jgi:hypothetical protein
MALVSPGIQISINDQSQYVNSNIGSVPLVVLATAQDKTYNGALASGTTKANAGKLLSFSGQRDLVTQMGTPTFQIGADGTPVNGSEINEYGLMAAYSALGLTNQLYAIRADIDLNELKGTTVRPLGAPDNDTLWVDTDTTQWGIYDFDATASTFGSITPLIIKDASQVQSQTVNSTTISAPIKSVGNIGDYALVFINTDGTKPTAVRLFYKKGPYSYTGSVASNSWVLVGSPDWQDSQPVTIGTVVNPTIPVSSTLTINTITVTSDGTVTTLSGANGLVAKINAASIPGVHAGVSPGGKLMLFATSSATSTGSSADGKIVLTDGTHTPLAAAGVTVKPYYCPILFYGDYSTQPTGGWYATDTQPRPTGSIWWKTSALGDGWNPVFKKYNSNLNQWQVLTAAPLYTYLRNVIYGLDPTGGGINIPGSTFAAEYAVVDGTYNSIKFMESKLNPTASATGGSTGTFAIGDTFTLSATAPGTSNFTTYTIQLTTTTAIGFVEAILAANIPYVTASLNTVGAGSTITITHTTNGAITLANTVNTPLATAGFTTALGGSGYTTNGDGSQVYISIFEFIDDTINFQASEPYSPPAAGTHWYNSDAVDVDIMINNSGWKGYRNVTSDVRGFNLSNTDPMGVIVTPTTAPTSQSDGTSLVAGDLWLDSGDLVNYPSLYRYNGSKWVAIDNTDHVSSAGIVFADARWDTDGTTNVITGDFPSIQALLSSNYLDLDAPDYRLYPRGALLFNTRRSGYNVKTFVPNYFNDTSFPDVGANTIGLPTSLPTVKDAWVSASGLDANDVMYAGSQAQRNMVIGAMQAAVDSNLDVLSPMFQFNLLVAPNYPELIDNLLVLNENRGDTAFVIGDTPLDLAPNSVDISNWINNTNGMTGYVVPSSPYLALYYPAGRTNDLAGNEIVVPASHAVLRTYLYNDQVAYPWFAPAGVQRGLVNNLSDIGYLNSTGGFVHNAINNGLRDALFTLKINPITQLPASGICVWGQLTRSALTSARDRVNVVRLENYLRTIFQSIANGYLFEPNDNITRKSISSAIAGSLNTILAHRGLYDFLVICDSSNNTSATIANNQLYVDVAIEPERDVEFIYIPIAIYNPGAIATLG